MRKNLLCLSVIFAFTFFAHGYAQQCLGSGFCSGGNQYPSGTFSSNTSSWTSVSTLIYAGEYAVYNVTSGSTYEWSLCSSDGGSVSYDAQLTLINNSTLANLCYSDNQCASNTPKIQWAATFTGTVRVLVSQFNCATNSTFTTLVWRCSSCGSGSAPVNDNCSGSTALTVDAAPTAGTVSGATNSFVTGCAGTAEDDVWYSFTTSSAGYYTITVVGSASFDAVADLRSGACNGSNVYCADNANAGGTEIINYSLSAATTYYIRVYDYFSTSPATLTFTVQVTKPATCTPSYTYGTVDGDYINNVTLSSINNTSGAGPGYSDYYGTISTTLQAGTSNTLSATVGTFGSQTIAAWIDYNEDGDFADLNESLGEVTNVDIGGTATINFTIPAATAAGNKRMRVRDVWSGVTVDPCASYSWGEAEDYKIIVTPACTTPGDPTGLTTTGITNAGAQLNWSASTGSATITYYWAIGSAANVTYEANYLQRGTTTSLNSGAISSLSPGTTYYWTVKAQTDFNPCASPASQYASSISFVTLCTTPATPVTPSTSGITNSGATFNWTAGSPAGDPTVTYYWAVGPASSVTYESGYTDRGTTTSLSATTSILSDNSTYYWKVKALTSCNGSVSSYTAATSFNTLCITPGVPVNMSTSGITSTTATFNWAAGSPAGTPTVTYYWAIGPASNVTYEANYSQRGFTTSITASVSGLTQGSTYYWTVKAVTSCDNSPSSYPSALSFITVPAPLRVWTGATSNEWNLASNWNPSDAFPDETYNVIIPDVSGSSNRYPITTFNLSINNTTASRKCKSLTISPGASVTLTGGTSFVYISGEVNLSGTLNHECGPNSNQFQINSGGIVTVKNGGILNVGSSAISGGLPAGTINQFNDIDLNGGTLQIDPGGKVFIMDNLRVAASGAGGTLNMTGGDLYIVYYGDGSAASLGFDTYGTSSINISGGNIYLCGQDATGTMADWNASATYNISGGTIHLLNEQSTGSTNNSGYINFAGKIINNLTVNRSAAISYISTNSIVLNGNLTITAGTFNANGLNLTLKGSWSNSGTFTPGAGIVTFNGNSNSDIYAEPNFSNLVVLKNGLSNLATLKGNIAASGYCYIREGTLNIGGYTASISGTFRVNTDAAGNEDNVGNAKIKMISAFDVIDGATHFMWRNGSQIDITNGIIYCGGDWYMNNTGSPSLSFTGSNKVYFDKAGSSIIQNTNTTNQGATFNDIYIAGSGTKSLQHSINIINGNLTISAGILDANGKDITLAGNLTNNGTFTDGLSTGTVTFTGSSKLIDGSGASTFNHVIFNNGSGYTLNSTAGQPQATFGGTFNLSSGATLNLATGNVITLAGASDILNGTITASDVYDGNRDIGLTNVGGQLSGTGSVNADLQVSSGSSTLMNNFSINGDFLINTGTFVMTSHTLTLYGNWTNNGTFTSGTGTIVFAGNTKEINGSTVDGAASQFNNLTFQQGASYTFNPSVATNWNIYGSFFNYGTINIASPKFLDIYSISTDGESIIQDGTITAVSANDGTKDIDINFSVNLSGTGTTNADIRIYGGITTLASNFTLNGDFRISSLGPGTFTMTTHTFSLGGDWENFATFNSGTGTVKFTGSASRTIDANCNFSGSAKASADFYNVIVDRGTDTISMISTPMRVANDFTIENGIFSTGWRTNINGNDGCNRRLTVVKIATIKPGGQLFIGYQRTWCTGTISADEANTGCPLSGDSLNVPVFRGDVINYGTIQTYRPKSSGYSDFKLKGARVTGLGTTNEFGVDIQPEDGQTVTQVGPVDIQGDLIIQDPAANLWENTDPNNILTIRGNFYLFGSFTHNGTVNVYGNMNSSTYTTDNITINSSTFNFYQSGATRFIYLDKNPIAFGHLNVIAGANTRELRQHITVSGNLTITSGTFDMYAANNSNITLSGSTGSWTNNGTFTPRSGTVSFTGNGAQSMGGTSSTTFNNLTIANTSGTGVTFNNSGTVTGTLTLTDGIVYTTSSKLLTLNDQANASPAGGVAGSYVNGPVKKIGRDGVAGLYEFLFPIGKNNIWARLYILNGGGITANTDAFTAEFFDAGYDTYNNVNSPLTNVSSLEYWNLTKNSGDAGLNKKIRLYSEDKTRSQISAYNNADLTVAHWNGTKWDDIDNPTSATNSGNTSPAGWITSRATNNFSPFTFGSRSGANPLPVELLTFGAKLNGEKVDLFWTTAVEINNDYFTVQRSADLENFENVSTVKGAGNSNSPVNYTSADNNPVLGLSYYRLKQVDFDGTVTYSKPVAISFSQVKLITGKAGAISKILVYPNPGNGLININFENSARTKIDFKVFDLMGRMVKFSSEVAEAGNVIYTIDLQHLSAGSYILILENEEQRLSQKLIIQK